MLEIRNLNVFYDQVHVLKDVSLRLEKGSCLTLLGANGAGKSTLINAICGLIGPASGSIVFAGREISRLPAYRIVGLGIAQVPEGRQVFANMTVRDNLRLGAYARLSKEGKKDIQADLEKVFDMFPRLRERKNQLSGTLSGGEQQMLALGRAIMSHPKLILLDEPSLGLAPLVVSYIFEMISRLRQEGGISILMVEQNARAALRIANRGCVLETGRITMEGLSSELINNPELQKAFLGGSRA
ncbi:MAG: ABC transporter ATP-binding protein [Thermodesulfobacteriota bacterium]